MDKRDGAIIKLDGVGKGSKHLLIWGEAVDVDILKTLPELERPEGLRRLQLRGIDGRGADLTAVAGLPNFERLDLRARDFAMDEGVKVAAAHPFVLRQLPEPAET